MIIEIFRKSILFFTYAMLLNKEEKELIKNEEMTSKNIVEASVIDPSGIDKKEEISKEK